MLLVEFFHRWRIIEINHYSNEFLKKKNSYLTSTFWSQCLWYSLFLLAFGHEVRFSFFFLSFSFSNVSFFLSFNISVSFNLPFKNCIISVFIPFIYLPCLSILLSSWQTFTGIFLLYNISCTFPSCSTMKEETWRQFLKSPLFSLP